MNYAILWTARWTRKLLDFLFWIRLRATPQGCRNLLRTSARKGATGTEPRIRTVRQLAAAAGDGSLGFAGSPGQLETSLNSGYLVGPCNSYLEGPTLVFGHCSHPFVWACCSRNRALSDCSLRSQRCSLGCRRRRCSQRKERLCSLLLHTARRWGWCSLRSRSLCRCGGARFPTLAAVFLSCSRPALLADQTERSDRVTLLNELGNACIDLAAGEVVDGQALHDLVGAT
jgi:hypothetical protein